MQFPNPKETDMKYKALITDLDGTVILNEQYAKPTPRVVKAINEAQKVLKVSTATGRPFSTAEWVMKPLKISSPSIITAGTQIIDPLTGRILWEETMDKEIVQKILTFTDTLPYDVILASQYVTFPEQPRPKKIQSEAVIYIGWVPISESDAIVQKIKTIANVSVHAAMGYPSNTYGLHVTSINASKKHAIHKLMEILGVTKNEIIGIGDSNNDLPLFEAVGLKIAMGNATDLLKENADYIAPSVEDDGVADVIKRFILNS